MADGRAAPSPDDAPSAAPTAGVDALDEWLSRPGPALPALLAGLQGDLVVLGAGGKMGPTLARMARRALTAAGGAAAERQVVAVSRFSDAASERALHEHGVRTVRGDLTDPDFVRALPPAAGVVLMAGQKFGTAHDPGSTWMTNVVVPAHCARRYAGTRMVALSTGNVYALTPVNAGGSRETDPGAPAGEYAWTSLGRERVLGWHAAQHGTPMALVRLFYANALRYGVLTDIAQRVWTGVPVDVTMGAVNVIWQGDANRLALAALAHAGTPPAVVNVAGAEALPVRWLAEELGRRLHRAPMIHGIEAPDALLANPERMQALLGAPVTTTAQLLDWTAEWVSRGLPTLDRPTHFDVRDGRY